MSDETPRLKLAQLVSLQELNAVTWNEALANLDAVIDLYLLGQFVNTPPASPSDGDTYIVGGAPTGAWSGSAYKIAACLDGAWRFYAPYNGLRAYVASKVIVYVNGVWSAVGSTDFATKSGTETLTNKTLGATALPGGGAISSSGWIGVGTAAATAGLDVETGSIRINNGITGAGQSGTIYLGDGSFSKAYGGSWAFVGGAQISGCCWVDSFGTALLPYDDNGHTIGSAAHRWSVVYAGTGTINTSGSDTKTNVRGVTDAEIAVAQALARNVRIFQFVDAVATKGGAARLHAGMVFEDVVAAFAAEGLDPMHYGIVCRDPAVKPVEKIRQVERQKTQRVTQRTETIEVQNGRAVLRVIEAARDMPVFETLAVVDEAGAPVLNSDGSPRTYDHPVLEKVEERYVEEGPDLDAAGQPKWILGLRYSELTQFILAGLAAR